MGRCLPNGGFRRIPQRLLSGGRPLGTAASGMEWSFGPKHNCRSGKLWYDVGAQRIAPKWVAPRSSLFDTKLSLRWWLLRNQVEDVVMNSESRMSPTQHTRDPATCWLFCFVLRSWCVLLHMARRAVAASIPGGELSLVWQPAEVRGQPKAMDGWEGYEGGHRFSGPHTWKTHRRTPVRRFLGCVVAGARGPSSSP